MDVHARMVHQPIDEILLRCDYRVRQRRHVVGPGAKVRVRALGQQRGEGGRVAVVLGNGGVMLRQPGERRMPAGGAGANIWIRPGRQQRPHHVVAACEGSIDDGLPVLNRQWLTIDRRLESGQVTFGDSAAKRLVVLQRSIRQAQSGDFSPSATECSSECPPSRSILAAFPANPHGLPRTKGCSRTVRG